MPLLAWWTVNAYGPGVGAAVDQASVGTLSADIQGWAEPSATVGGAGVVADADATRLVNSPATLTGVGVITGAAMKMDAVPQLVVSIGSRPSAVDIAEAVVAQRVHPLGSETIGDVLALLTRLGRNKTITDPVSGEFRVYTDDGTTVLYSADLYEDAAGTTPYAGNGAERREGLT